MLVNWGQLPMFKRGVLGDAFTLSAVIIGVGMLLFGMIFAVQVYNFKGQIKLGEEDPYRIYLDDEEYCDKEIASLLRQEITKNERILDSLEASLKPYSDFLDKFKIHLDYPLFRFDCIVYSKCGGQYAKEELASRLLRLFIYNSPDSEKSEAENRYFFVTRPDSWGYLKIIDQENWANKEDEKIIDIFRKSLGNKEYLLYIPQGFIVNIEGQDYYNNLKGFERTRIFNFINLGLKEFSNSQWKYCKFRYGGEKDGAFVEVWLLK